MTRSDHTWRCCYEKCYAAQEQSQKLSTKWSVPAQAVLQTYFTERLLARIAVSKYQPNLVFKGGFLIASVIGNESRSTMDLDATLQGAELNEGILRHVDQNTRLRDYYDVHLLLRQRKADIRPEVLRDAIVATAHKNGRSRYSIRSQNAWRLSLTAARCVAIGVSIKQNIPMQVASILIQFLRRLRRFYKSLNCLSSSFLRSLSRLCESSKPVLGEDVPGDTTRSPHADKLQETALAQKKCDHQYNYLWKSVNNCNCDLWKSVKLL